MQKVIVIGGGAAGIMAAIAAKERGANVTLLEKISKSAKRSLLPVRGAATLPMQVPWKISLQTFRGMGHFFTVPYINSPILM